ncbi:hypothetical protein, partial [Candidatus Binatus sp.]|uniref:hypothetical protein n=1 Tax=Candidatus Binatus sp. TaxID=2811406 RepID=UPI002F940A1C
KSSVGNHVPVQGCPDSDVGLIGSSTVQIAAKRLPITTEQDRSPSTSIPTKSPFLAGFVAS